MDNTKTEREIVFYYNKEGGGGNCEGSGVDSS